ncbi:MAG: PKD domain-containing protein [Bacteroidota bacterium]
MKKIYSLLCFICISAICIAQAQIQVNPFLLHPKKQFVYNKAPNTKNAVSKSSTISNQGWFNYGEKAEILYGTTSDVSSNYLFPDSLGYGDFGGTIAPCWIHHLGELVDFRSIVFSLDPSTSWVESNGAAPFKIDSMSIFYAYTRNHPNPNIIDTLIVTVFDNTSPSNLAISGMTGAPATNYLTDTICYRFPGYNSVSNLVSVPNGTMLPTSTPNGEYKFKVLLTLADTAIISYREKKFNLPIPFSSNGGKLVVADVMFKPGYTYSLGQNISATANAFYFSSMEENGHGGGFGTYMNYMDCGFGSDLCDYSSSSIVSQQVRYNMSTPSWNYHYIPALAYTMPYAYEHHLISFHLIDTIPSPCQVNSQFSIFPDTLTPGNYSAYNNSTGTGIVSYLWDFGDGNTSSLQYPSHQYAVPGQYIVCLTTSATAGTITCSDMYCDSSSVQKMASGFLMSHFNVIPQIVTHISKTETITEINAYPNPMGDKLIIELISIEQHTLHYVLVDALGRTVSTGDLNNPNAQINTADLAKGFYSLSITNAKGNNLKTIKLVK